MSEDELKDIPEPDGPCCVCGKEATHKHLDDNKNYCDKCCDLMNE